MWSAVIDFLQDGLSACFGWVDRIFSAIPGSWDTIFTFITIILISRFVLGPIVGKIPAGSDRAKKSGSDPESTAIESRKKDV